MDVRRLETLSNSRARPRTRHAHGRHSTRTSPPTTARTRTHPHPQVVRQLPAVRASLDSVHLVETSPTMRALQRATLHTAHDHGRVALAWHDALDQVPRRDDRFTMLVAHEFFDALPVHVIEVRRPSRLAVQMTGWACRKRPKGGTRCSSRPPTTRVFATPARPLPSSPPAFNPFRRGGRVCSPRRPRPRRRSSGTPPRASQHSPSALASKFRRRPSRPHDTSPSYSPHHPLPKTKVAEAGAPSSSTMAPKKQSATRCACVFVVVLARVGVADTQTNRHSRNTRSSTCFIGRANAT